SLRRGPVPGNQLHGEWVGFAKLNAIGVQSLAALIQQQIARGETSGGYEDVLAQLLSAVPFAAAPTNGAPWIEIDFAADLARAQELFADEKL
ncbi:MAG: phosphocholine cytidylyltransferase family protein, partial [Gemmatimonadaceae bacterium]